MSDTIMAAWISGGLQAISALATIVAAWIALKSWRRHTLGTKQIELAEQCLVSLWSLDKKIRAARMLLPPAKICTWRKTKQAQEHYAAQHARALSEMRSCRSMLGDFINILSLAEFYLGRLPVVEFEGKTKIIKKISYSIDKEYDDVINALISILIFDVSPKFLESTEISDNIEDNFAKSANLYFGFIYEYEEDEFSIRLNLAKRTFERHVRNILRRRSFFERVSDAISNKVVDRFQSKFKPATINKYANLAPVETPKPKEKEETPGPESSDQTGAQDTSPSLSH